jgi:2-amino-4-hydroxy-6-hydroxymethyldihydropteridine diphosphokinase
MVRSLSPGDTGSAPIRRRRALLGLGSNLGEREGNLRRAVELLKASPGVLEVRLSSIRETRPVGEPGDGPLGGPYLNAAAEVLTTLEPRELLEVCLGIEACLGRVRGGRNAPRPIDLDLLLYEDRVIAERGLEVPHPRMLGREFVMEPAAELAPGRRHPRTGRTLQEHLEALRSSHARHG